MGTLVGSRLPVRSNDAFAACCNPVTGGVVDTNTAEALARIFRALGDPTRVRLLSLIAAHADSEACVCDLTEPVGLLSADRVTPPQATRRRGSSYPRTAREVGVLPGRTGCVGQSGRRASGTEGLTERGMRCGSGRISPATARANDIGVVWVLRWLVHAACVSVGA